MLAVEAAEGEVEGRDDGAGGRTTGVGSSFTRDAGLAALLVFVAEWDAEAEDPVSDKLRAESSLSSSGSQIPAVSSRLTTTELPDAAVTRSERLLQGKPPRTEP